MPVEALLSKDTAIKVTTKKPIPLNPALEKPNSMADKIAVM